MSKRGVGEEEGGWGERGGGGWGRRGGVSATFRPIVTEIGIYKFEFEPKNFIFKI